MIYWSTEDGYPLGFYHDSAPAELKDLFVTNLDAMFLRSEEVSIATLISPEGPLIGKMLDPELQQRFWRGNIYQHLCVPLGHYHLLDMRAHIPGLAMAGFAAWNPKSHPFTTMHAKMLEPIQPLMHQALAANSLNTRWRSISTVCPHLITSSDGRELVAIDDEAEQILMASHLLGQNFTPAQTFRKAPGFAAVLAGKLRSTSSAELHLPVVDGRLVCRATHTRFLQSEGNAIVQVFISLDLQVAEEVSIIDWLTKLALSPMQREIALFALKGGERAACMSRFDISFEALKKHLKVIFSETGTTRWTDLVALEVPLIRSIHVEAPQSKWNDGN